MPTRCAFRIDVDDEVARLATDLRERHGIADVDVAAFDDIPTTDGVWRCPRLVTDGESCPFHAAEADDEAVLEALQAAVRGEGPPTVDGYGAQSARRFIGLTAGTLAVTERDIPLGAAGLDVRFAELDELRLSDAVVAGGVRVDGGTVERVVLDGLDAGADVSFRHADITGQLSAAHSRLDGALNCRGATVAGDVDVTGATAGGRFAFDFAEVGGTVTAIKGSCVGRFTLKESAVGAVAASGLAVAGPDPASDLPGLQFRGVTVDGDVTVADCDCEGTLIGYDVTTGGDFDATGATIRDDVLFGQADGTALPEATIRGSLSLATATVGGTCLLAAREQYDTGPEVGGVLSFEAAAVDELRLAPRLTHDRVSVVDCRGAAVGAGVFGQPDAGGPVAYDLTEATVGDVSIDGGGRPATETVWFDRTEFDGFRFAGEARAAFRADDWQLVDDEEPSADRIAYARAFPDANGYATDLRALLAAKPSVCSWLATTDPPYDIGAVAARVFDDFSVSATERIAKNGPEQGDQLGRQVYDRERYRAGVATCLARELHDVSHPIEPLFEEVGADVQTLAVAVSGPSATADREHGDGRNGEAPRQRTDSDAAQAAVRDRLAAVLADPEAVRPSVEELEQTYIDARKGADDVGDSSVAGNFFRHEARVRRRAHRAANAYHRYASNWLFDLVAGYGERPLRPFAASVLTVVAFAGLFQLVWLTTPATPPAVYDGPVGATLLSLASFTAFLFGGIDVAPFPLRAVATVESFLGAFLLALFVFTLTRSLHR